MPCHLVRGMEGVGTRLFGTYDGKTWGIDAGENDERGQVFSAMDCDSRRLARCPPSGRVRVRRGRPAVSRGRTPIGASLPGLLGPVSTSGSPRRRHSSSAVLRGSGYGHRPAYSSENLDPVVQGPSGSGAAGVLDAEDTPGDPQSVPPLILPVVVEETEVLISETGGPPLTLPVVDDISYDTPASEMVPMTTTPPESSLPPPPGFAPFVFPENDGGMDVEDLCTLFSGDSSLTLSPISRGSSDISNAPDVPEVGAWCPP